MPRSQLVGRQAAQGDSQSHRLHDCLVWSLGFFIVLRCPLASDFSFPYLYFLTCKMEQKYAISYRTVVTMETISLKCAEKDLYLVKVIHSVIFLVLFSHFFL